jgi:CubicO group peptidase (beta-lactamase class C family)
VLIAVSVIGRTTLPGKRALSHKISVRRAASLCVFLILLGCATLNLEVYGQDITVTGQEEPALASFDSTVMEFMRAHEITGAALAVTKDGRVLMERGYTYRPTDDDVTVRPTSRFRIASISKPITAVAVLKLVEQGRLRLTDRIVDVLDLGAGPREVPDPRLGDVTVRHLLEHLGGWDRDASLDPMFQDAEIARTLGRRLPVAQSDIITFMSGRALQYAPGSTFAYSNYGYMLLGRVIERASGVDYETFVREEVLEPVGASGMRLGRSLQEQRRPDEVTYHAGTTGSSVFSEDTTVKAGYGNWNHENLDAHGGWVSTAGDVARFAASFDAPERHPVLTPSSIERMFALPENVDPDDYQPGSPYYSIGWMVRDYGGGERNTWHGGSLPGTFTLLVRRRDGLGWVLLFNRRGDGFEAIDALLHQAADRVREWPRG